MPCGRRSAVGAPRDRHPFATPTRVTPWSRSSRCTSASAAPFRPAPGTLQFGKVVAAIGDGAVAVRAHQRDLGGVRARAAEPQPALAARPGPAADGARGQAPAGDHRRHRAARRAAPDRGLRLEGRSGTAIASRPETLRFHREVACWAAAFGWLRDRLPAPGRADVKDKRCFQALASSLGPLSRTTFQYGRPAALRTLDLARRARCPVLKIPEPDQRPRQIISGHQI